MPRCRRHKRSPPPVAAVMLALAVWACSASIKPGVGTYRTGGEPDASESPDAGNPAAAPTAPATEGGVTVSGGGTAEDPFVIVVPAGGGSVEIAAAGSVASCDDLPAWALLSPSGSIVFTAPPAGAATARWTCTVTPQGGAPLQLHLVATVAPPGAPSPAPGAQQPGGGSGGSGSNGSGNGDEDPDPAPQAPLVLAVAGASSGAGTVASPLVLPIAEGATARFTLTATGTGAATAFVTCDGPGFAAVVTTPQRALELTPDFDQAGMHAASCRAQAGAATSATVHLQLAVANVNRSPTLAYVSHSGGASALTGDGSGATPYAFTVLRDATASVQLAAADPDGQTPAFSCSPAHPAVTVDAGARTVTIAPASEHAAAPIALSCTASDGTASSPTVALRFDVGFPRVLRLLVVPAKATVSLATTRALQALATFADGTTEDVTDLASWARANGTGTATIGADGVLSAVGGSEGTVAVNASFQGAKAAAAVTVGPATACAGAALTNPLASNGDGGSTPYLICTLAQLDAMRSLSGSFRLGQDVDASPTAAWNGGLGWAPVTMSSLSFDGGGFVIRGLTIARPATSNVGLFAELSGSTVVFDLSLLDVAITGDQNVGALSGTGEGIALLSAITVTGAVTGGSRVGGVLGTWNPPPIVGMNLLIADSRSAASINASGSYAGGIIGLVWNDSTSILALTRNVATGDVRAGSYAGGLIGRTVDGVATIIDAHAYGPVHTTGNYAGGLIGFGGAGNWSVQRVSAHGAVNAGGNSAGGLMGAYTAFNVSLIQSSFATGTVAGVNLVGGLFGQQSAPVSTSYASGAVTGTSNVGGLSGVAGAAVTSSFATGAVTGTSNAGELVGSLSDGQTVTDSYALDAAGQGCVGLVGTGATAGCTSVPAVSHFHDVQNAPLDQWDFATVWELPVPAALPRLR